MLRENFCTNSNLAETDPWEDDREGHTEDEPEGRRLHQCLAERLASEAVVIGEENDLSEIGATCQRGYLQKQTGSTHLNPDERSCSPSEESVGTLEAVMCNRPDFRICECDNADKKGKDTVRDHNGCNRSLKE